MRYAFFISSRSSNFLRILISSRRRASAWSSSKCNSLRRISSSSASLFLASILPSMALRTRVFSFSFSWRSRSMRSSRSRLSRANCSMRSFSARSSASIFSWLAFCSSMNFCNIWRDSTCFSERAFASLASSSAILATSSSTCFRSLMYSFKASSRDASFMAICCWLMTFTRWRCLRFSMFNLFSNSCCSKRSFSICWSRL
mmetsp:Transcript_2675/g.4680  ORF Transcript_2675/g.4680 Transcript_2675/m.4680 type:complete len:201 (-) Transcript_2675:489-1091(-)